ncbi:hypothetical protein BVRB_7g161410 isoform A [Beta vulgaris subsp. vulgaris]|nr:hypothetical protein BVRB_7g161410 isoform A [Beta vulgaris subsp. vulgaris]
MSHVLSPKELISFNFTSEARPFFTKYDVFFHFLLLLIERLLCDSLRCTQGLLQAGYHLRHFFFQCANFSLGDKMVSCVIMYKLIWEFLSS